VAAQLVAPQVVLGSIVLVSFMGFEILTVVVMKNSIFWDIMLCNPFKVNLHFGGT
jgi:hypothetical protein